MMKKYLLTGIASVVLLLIILAVPGKDSFKLDAEGVQEIMAADEYIISPEQLITLKEESEAVLIDLGSPEEFSNSSLPGALNLPLEEISIQSIGKMMAGNDLTILYASKTSTACQVWILLTQMGYENLMVLDRN